MNILFLIILGLFIVLVIQIFEVYLTLRINHDLSDEVEVLVDECENLRERLRIAERRLIDLESEKKKETQEDG